MEENSVEHKLSRDDWHVNGILCACSCGATWSVPRNNGEVNEKLVQSLFQSHLKYFNKIQHTVL